MYSTQNLLHLPTFTPLPPPPKNIYVHKLLSSLTFLTLKFEMAATEDGSNEHGEEDRAP